MTTDFLQFARRLADNDLALRTETLRSLESYLGARGAALSHVEHAKIWKGLFYCVWLSDGMLVQQQLSRDLAALVHCFRDADADGTAAMAFVRAFCDTLQREWTLLDVHRVDKYYYLLRQVLREAIRFVARRDWSGPLCAALRDMLLSSALSLSGIHYAGLSLAIARHFCPSLHDVAREEATDPGAALAGLVEPFLRFYALALDKAYIFQITDTFFEPLLNCDPAADRFGALSLLSVAEMCDELASDRKLNIPPKRRQFLYQIKQRIETQVKRKQTPLQRTDGDGADDDDAAGDAIDDDDEADGDMDDLDAALGDADDDAAAAGDVVDENDVSNNNNNTTTTTAAAAATDDGDNDDDDLAAEQENQPPPPVLARVDSEVSIDMTPKKHKKLLGRVDSEVSFDLTPKPKKQRAEPAADAVPAAAAAEAAAATAAAAAVEAAAALKRRVSWGAAHERSFHGQEPPATVADGETHQAKIKTHKPKPKFSFLPVRMQQQQQQQRNKQQQKKKGGRK
jgi:ribosomal RNA-processing protein 1